MALSAAGGRRGADLIRAAGLAIRGGGVTVPFAGIHADGNPADAAAALGQLSTREPWGSTPLLPLNALAARIGGVATALVVGARGPDSPRHPSEPHSHSGVFEGQAAANLSFLSDQSRAAEGILVLRRRHSPIPSVGDCREMAGALSHLSHLATAMNAPIQFAYAPSAPPPRGRKEARGDGSREQWRWVDRACIRFALGVRSFEPEARLAFYRALTEYCSARGFDLHLADRRFPRGGGRWFELAGAASRAEDTQRPRAEPLHLLLPLTVIGPARVGTTHAVVSYLSGARIGIKGATITSLGDLALINLNLAVPRALAPAVALASREPALRPAVTELARVGSLLSSHPYPHLGEPATSRLADYRCVVGTPRRPSPSSSRWRALWITWEAPSAARYLWLVVDVLRGALARVSDRAGIDLAVEHLICRCVSEDLARGRCKISVAWREGGSHDAAHEMAIGLAGQVEDALRQGLDLREGGLGGVIDVQASPYEASLGRWSTPTALI